MTSRITVILHPNTSRVSIVLNDRVFNKERYSFSRKAEPIGPEKIMLDVLNDCIIGIINAEAAKNELSLEISECTYPSDYIPQVILAVKNYVGESDYSPVIYCDDRRYTKEPEYNSEGWTVTPGITEKKGSVNLGIPYVVWED